MYYCALKSDCMAYIIFTGAVNPGNCPKWYTDMFARQAYMNEYNYYVITDVKDIYKEAIPWEDTLTEGYDVFLRNKVGKVLRTNIYELDNKMIEVADGTVALSDSCLPYVIFNGGDIEKYPDWFQDFYYNTLKNIMTEKVELPIVVVMRETWDDEDTLDVKYQIIEYNLFKQHYFFQGHGIDWNGFRYDTMWKD